MFGALVGTLQRFNKEEVKKKDVTEKQKEKLMKVEERTEKEKEEIKNRKRELFTDQKKKKQDIKILHIQMRRVEEYETWEKSKKQEANFIRTKADPPLYWLPKTISDKSIGKTHIISILFLTFFSLRAPASNQTVGRERGRNSERRVRGGTAGDREEDDGTDERTQR